MSIVIMPLLTVYTTRVNLRRLVAKARAAYATDSLLDQHLWLDSESEHVVDLAPDTKIVIVIPVAPIDIRITNADGSIRLHGVDRMFVCPANLTGLSLFNTSLKQVEVQLISG